MLIIKTKISITIQPKIVCAEFILWLASHSPPFMPLKTVNPYFPPNDHSSSCFTLVWAEVRREVKIKSSSTTVHLASSTSHHIWRQRPSLYSLFLLQEAPHSPNSSIVTRPRCSCATQVGRCRLDVCSRRGPQRNWMRQCGAVSTTLFGSCICLALPLFWFSEGFFFPFFCRSEF